ncbi:MAG: hypothetical protein L3K05_08480, partial [Thermoplasmata archaeon]|nr:hypothetical protein [Thermoplasmata archaeon]
SSTEVAETGRTIEKLDEALSEDFNTREAIAALFSWTGQSASVLAKLEQLSSESLSTLLGPFDWAAAVLGLCGGIPLDESSVVPEVVQASLDARARARDRGDFPEADRIRDALAAAGIVVEDHGGVTRWRLRGSER